MPIQDRATRAFTVVELMVVIAVIMILIGLALPSLAKARESARAVRSSSNVRGIGESMAMYSSRFRGAYPIGETGVLYPVSVDGGISMSFSNHFEFGRGWPVLVRDAAPWDEFYRTWISPGGTVPGASQAAISAFSYQYSHSFLARPGLWRIGAMPDAALLSAVRDSEVVFPSQKVQVWDAMMPYLLRPVPFGSTGMLANPAPMLFADGHAASHRPGDATPGIVNVMNPNAVEAAQPLHNTPLGVLGRDY